VSQEAHFLFPAPPSIVRSHFIIRQPPLQPFLSIQEPRAIVYRRRNPVDQLAVLV
jgi:hypothetical protein